MRQDQGWVSPQAWRPLLALVLWPPWCHCFAPKVQTGQMALLLAGAQGWECGQFWSLTSLAGPQAWGHPGPAPTRRGPGACLKQGPLGMWLPFPWGCLGLWATGAASWPGLPWSPRPLTHQSRNRLEGRATSPLAWRAPSSWHLQPVPVPAAAGPEAGSVLPLAEDPACPPGCPAGAADTTAPPRPLPLRPSGSGAGDHQGLQQGPGGCSGGSEGAGTEGDSGGRGGQPEGHASGTCRAWQRPAGSWGVGKSPMTGVQGQPHITGEDPER